MVDLKWSLVCFNSCYSLLPKVTDFLKHKGLHSISNAGGGVGSVFFVSMGQEGEQINLIVWGKLCL